MDKNKIKDPLKAKKNHVLKLPSIGLESQKLPAT